MTEKKENPLKSEVKGLKETIKGLRRSLRASKREARSSWSLVREYEKELDVVNALVETVETSLLKLPPIKPPKIVSVADSKNEEVVGLLLSDTHIGKKTASYNPRVFIKRLRCLEGAMMSVVNAHRSIRPIKKLVVVMNGDIVDAESIYPGQAVDGISLPLIDQIFTVGVPELTKFLYFCLANFEEVEVYCQSGNHGRLNASKWSTSKSTNWDYVLYKALEGMTQNQDRLMWHINTKEWKSTFRILGHGFMATHGDMIKMYYNMPYYGMSRQAMRWANTYRSRIKLTHFLFGHFHTAGTIRFNQIWMHCNGSFITDDVFGEEKIGVGSVPEQLLFGVHPKRGVTWRYPLLLL
jgi:hypothetical protein